MKILCAIDPNDEAFMRVLETALRLRGESDQLEVVHVLPEPLKWYRDLADPHEEKTRAERTRTTRLLNARLDGESASIVVLTGGTRNPGESVVSLAEKTGADLIVLGNHGRTGLAAITLGSVAERVVRKAPCDVYVVRA